MPSMWAVLTQERADLTREALALSETAAARTPPGYTAEEQARDDAIAARQTAITPMLAREEERRAWERSVEAVPGQVGLQDVARVSNVRSPADQPFANLGEQLQAIYQSSIPGGYRDPRLSASLGMNETIGADGGYLVQQDLIPGILRKVFEGGQILSRVRRIPVGANANGVKLNAIRETSRATGSRWGGVQGYWLPEGGLKLPTRPELRQIRLELNKIACLGYATDELMADAPALTAVMEQAFADELRFMAEDSVINGTGAGQPLGILNSPATISVAKESGQAGLTVLFENIIAMWSRLWPASRANAVWLVNSDITPSLYTMNLAVGVGGVPVFMPAGGISGAPFETLFGRPIIPVEYLPTLGTVGDILLADLSEYLFIDKGGIQQAQSMHVAFVTDEMAFRAVYRVDGQPAWESAVTPYKGTASKSPFVSLATRA